MITLFKPFCNFLVKSKISLNFLEKKKKKKKKKSGCDLFESLYEC